MGLFCIFLDIVVPPPTVSDYLYQIFLPMPLIILVIMFVIWLIKKIKQHKED